MPGSRKSADFAAVVLFPEGAMNAGRWNPVNPSHSGAASPLPAMTDDRHADALGVTRRERRREYQGTGGRDEEAPASVTAQRLPAAMRTANPAYAGFQSTTAATNDSRSDAGAGAHGSEYRRDRLRASSGGSWRVTGRERAPGLRRLERC